MKECREQMRKWGDEIGILKAKLTLDLVSINLKINVDYPDLFEENNLLH
jgi:hypothetical protein